ncbi:MAG: GTPase HflX [Planctomycetota bacterium]
MTQRKAILVATHDGTDHPFAELTDLTRSFGALVVGQVKRRRDEEDPHTLVRRGRVEEISMCALTTRADLLIVDRDLSPGQARNLEDLTGLAVLDRTQLILEIFAQRARSGDGKLQVELARLRYQLPRLGQNDGRLSRIGGGTARGGTGSTKGVGETKIERDRRALKRRIAVLTERVVELGERRREGRKQRRRQELPVVSLVGYTNAGKSTLFNLVTRAGVSAENRLFSTLDPTARRIVLPGGKPVILTDTVGFIRDLPEDLVAAFRATLEELQDASLLLHVADATDPEVFEHVSQVDGLLQTLGLHEIPRLLLFNKVDRVIRDEFRPLAERKGGHLISARDDREHDRLLDLIAKHLQMVCA